jgi:hypothetical protein
LAARFTLFFAAAFFPPFLDPHAAPPFNPPMLFFTRLGVESSIAVYPDFFFAIESTPFSTLKVENQIS